MFPRLIMVFLAALIMNTLISTAAVAETVVRVGGAGAGLGVMKVLAASFNKSHPDIKVKIMPNLGSSGGVKALLNGAVEVGISGRALKKDELASGAVAVACARSPFALIANKNVTKSDLTTRELEEIYKGRTVEWPNGKRIRMILRPESDTDTSIVKSISKGVEEGLRSANARKDLMVEVTDQEAARAVERIADSFGWATLMQIQSENLSVKTLSLNGVRPTVDAVAKGIYTVAKPLYLVTTAKPSPSSVQFIQFVLSAKGRSILATYGALPVPHETRTK